MTELLYRPRSRPTAPPDPGRAPAKIALSAVASAVLLGWGVCAVVALAGWYFADAGAHGQPTAALRVAMLAWLLGHGATLTASGVPLGITPLGLTLMLVVLGFRAGRRAVRTAPPREDRALVQAVATAVSLYVLAALAVSLGAGSADPAIGRVVGGALAVGVLGIGSGMAVGSGRARVWACGLPGYVRSIAEGALTGAAVLFAAGALLVAVGLAWSFSDAANLVTALHLGLGNALMLLIVSAMLAPNAALFGVAYLSGPGVALGAGTSVTAAGVVLGPLPAFPLLAALPGPGTPPAWAAAVYAVPALAAAYAAGRAQRRYAVVAWDSAAIRGFGGGVAGGVLLAALAALAGGPMGTGRMADIGVPGGELLVTLVGAMGLGGLIGGLVTAGWQRHRAR